MTPGSRSRASPSLPITTGNSYSASGALWAAHEAVDRLGLLERGDDGIIRGRTMVVGATGAIGSVCARLLALASDELWLVSPETAKLLALKQDIEREHPRAVVHAAATPGEHLARHGRHRHRDLGCRQAGARHHGRQARLRHHRRGPPARPVGRGRRQAAGRRRRRVRRDRAARRRRADARHRPAVRASSTPASPRPSPWPLEGRYETFTVGRAIEWEKVKEIYQLGLRHGMRLAAISGVNGVYTDEDFARVRQLALAARGGDGPRRHTGLTARRRPRHPRGVRGRRRDRRQRTSCPGCGSVGMVPEPAGLEVLERLDELLAGCS